MKPAYSREYRRIAEAGVPSRKNASWGKSPMSGAGQLSATSCAAASAGYQRLVSVLDHSSQVAHEDALGEEEPLCVVDPCGSNTEASYVGSWRTLHTS